MPDGQSASNSHQPERPTRPIGRYALDASCQGVQFELGESRWCMVTLAALRQLDGKTGDPLQQFEKHHQAIYRCAEKLAGNCELPIVLTAADVRGLAITRR